MDIETFTYIRQHLFSAKAEHLRWQYFLEHQLAIEEPYRMEGYHDEDTLKQELAEIRAAIMPIDRSIEEFERLYEKYGKSNEPAPIQDRPELEITKKNRQSPETALKGDNP